MTSPLKILRMRETTGPVDILVNNAGHPDDGLRRVEAVRRHQPRGLGRRDAPQPRRGVARHARVRAARWSTRAGGGSSRSSPTPAGAGERFQAIYGAAKAGAMGFVRGLAAEVGPHGVTANCVALGTMKTGVIDEALDQRIPSSSASWPGRTRFRGWAARPIRPLLVALLCSEAGSWITGQVYPVDGGYSPPCSPAAGSPGADAAGVLVTATIPLWPMWAVLPLGHGFAPSVQGRARTEASESPRPRARAAWRDELSEQLADHRIDAVAIGLVVFGLAQPACDVLRRRRPGRPGDRPRPRPGSSAGARCSCRSRPSPAAASTIVQRQQ